MTCPDDPLLLRFLQQESIDESMGGLDEHLEQCVKCQRRLEEFTSGNGLRRYYMGHDRQSERIDSQQPSAPCSEQSAVDRHGTTLERDTTLQRYERWWADAEREFDVARNRLDDSDTNWGSDDASRQHGYAKQFGRFRLKRLLGKGGFGVVYLAKDELLNRPVALKLPISPRFANPGIRRRFLREGEAAGRLQHPNIVPVFDTGQIDDVCFLSMAYCPGPTLHAWLARQVEPVEPRIAAQMVLPLAEAVQHAHDRDILHRDITPGNVLLEFIGIQHRGSNVCRLPFVPKLADFGLAKTLEADTESTVTAHGVIQGTPRYLAPEQAAGLVDQVGPASDVYALGAILYELLTLKPAIEGDNNAATLTRVISREPQPPRRLVPAISRDLEAICLKCLEKSPKHRYQSAQQLADDLRRYLNRESTVARPLGPVARFARWSYRNPAWSALVVVVFLSLSALGIGGWWSTTALKASLKTTQDLLYASDVRLAAESLEHAHGRRAEELLLRHVPDKAEADRRGFVWQYLWNAIHCEQTVLRSNTESSMWCVATSSTGQRVAGGNHAGHICCWNPTTGDLVEDLPAHFGAVRSLDFSPDDRYFVSTGDDQWLRVWDVSTHELQREFQPHEGRVYRAIYSPDNRWVVTCGADGVIRVWSAQTWDLQAELMKHTDRVYDIAFSADGQRLASAGADVVVRVWNLATKELEQELTDSLKTAKCYECVAISPDRRYVAAGTNDGDVIVWEIASGQQVKAFRDHTSNVFGIAFSPDGQHLASASKDTTVHIRDLVSDKLAGILQGHGRTVYDVCYLSDGGFLASCGKDGAVRIWKGTANAYQQLELPGTRAYCGDAGVHCIALSNSGQRTYLLDAVRRTGTSLSMLNASLKMPLAISADGHWLVAGKGEFIDPSKRLSLQSKGCAAISADVDGDGDHDLLASIGRRGALVWQELEGAGKFRRPQLLRSDFDASTVLIRRFTPLDFGDGTSGMIYNASDGVYLFPDPLNPFGVRPHRVGASAATVTCTWPEDMDGDGDLDVLLTTNDDHSVSWWENEGDFRCLQRHLISDDVTGPYEVIASDFDQDKIPEVAVVGIDGLVHLFRHSSPSFRSEWVAKVIDDDLVTAVAMDACDVDGDGSCDLLIASSDAIRWHRSVNGDLVTTAQDVEDLQQAKWIRPLPHNVVVWDLETRQPTSQFNALTEVVEDVALSSDGHELATVDSDDLIRLWETSSGRLLKTFPRVNETDAVSDLKFSVDDRLLLFAAGDNAYAWDLQGNPTKPRRFNGHNNTITCIVPSPAQMIAATTSHDYTVKIWDLVSGEARRTLVGHSQQPVTARFSRDGRILASAGHQGEIVLWDIETGQQLLTLSNLRCTNAVAVQFVDDQTLIAVGDQFVDPENYSVRIGTWRATREP